MEVIESLGNRTMEEREVVESLGNRTMAVMEALETKGEDSFGARPGASISMPSTVSTVAPPSYLHFLHAPDVHREDLDGP